jgi:hypothetical protein
MDAMARHAASDATSVSNLKPPRSQLRRVDIGAHRAIASMVWHGHLSMVWHGHLSGAESMGVGAWHAFAMAVRDR